MLNLKFLIVLTWSISNEGMFWLERVRSPFKHEEPKMGKNDNCDSSTFLHL